MSFALARRFRQDVSVDGVTWVRLGAITDFAPTENTTNQSSDNYDTNGFASFEKTLTGWQVVTKFEMPTTANIPSDAGQAILEATRFQFGTAARVYTRWYDRNGGTDAWSGLALVSWNQTKTGTADINEVTVTLQGDGALTRITNPYAATAVPVIVSATPSGVSVGNQVTINGSGFTGTVLTTGVKFGATNATSWTVLSDSVITATMPAGSAGSAAIVVTNAIGASTAFAYTRGA